MSYLDVFKDDFLSNYTSGDVRVTYVAAILGITCLIACYIFMVYRLVTSKTFYSKNFNISLAAIAVITAAIIIAVQSSIVISLGMVGALSIVRFRTAVKEPMDLCFLFWSIAVGICCGARMTEVACILSVVLTILVIILDRLPIGRAPMILIANLDDAKKEPDFMKKVESYCKYYKIKARNLSSDKCNLVIEIRVKQEYELVQSLSEMPGVINVSMVSHDGEVTY